MSSAGAPPLSRFLRQGGDVPQTMTWLRINATALLAVLVVGLVGCCSGVSAETVSTTKAIWEGKAGTAVTITQSGGTKDLEGVKTVSFELCGWRSDDEFWEVADFTVPVMKLEPREVTLFFSADDLSGAMMLEHLLSEFRRGKARISRCHPDRLC